MLYRREFCKAGDFLKNRKKRKRAGVILIILLLLSVVYYFFDAALFSAMGPLAKNKAETAATAAIESAVCDLDMIRDAENLTDILRDADGKILSMSTDTKKLAAFRAQLTEALTKELDDFRLQLQIPLGSVIGRGMLSGRGILLKLYVIGTGGLFVDTESVFESAGLNQTCHRVYVTVSTEFTLLYHGKTEMVTVSTKVLASETVIVGEVPNAYFGTYNP